MKILNNNLKVPSSSPIKLLCWAVFLLALVSLWLGVRMYNKDRAIAKLMKENTSLKKELYSLDEQLLELKNTASDVRLFQKELVKVLHDIDHKYPLSMSSKAHPHEHASQSNTQCPQVALRNVGENILQVASSQNTLRFQTASLLGKAVSIRDVLSHTPSMMPVGAGYISSDFGNRLDPFTKLRKKHHGIDIAAPLGTAVFASADGRVKIASRSRSFGNLIELEHADSYATTYGHLSEILVRKDQLVKRGQEIGRVGKTGTQCQGSHLHFEIKKNNVSQDPKPFLVSSPPRYM